MANQKLENILNLALETPEAVRRRTRNLNLGYDDATRTWEVIAKYHGSLAELESYGVQAEYLIAGYCILTVPEALMNRVAEAEEIEYVEKPKRYYFGVEDAKSASCVLPVTLREPFLDGAGVLVAILDTGIDYARGDFRRADGTTRIRFLWDQTLRATEEAGDGVLPADAAMPEGSAPVRRPPEGFRIGVEFGREEINQALAADNARQRYLLVPSRDTNGHGTSIAGIAAGGGEAQSLYSGVAPGSELLIVKLGTADVEGFPRTTQVMRGVTYAVRKALDLGMPLVVNLSFGNSYGAHDGSSLLERFLDNAAEIGRTVICVGSGNEGNSAGHVAGDVTQEPVAELAVGSYETSLSVQLWKHYFDRYRITLRSPGGIRQELSSTIAGGKYTLSMEHTQVLVYVGEPSPYSVDQEIYFEMIPLGASYINSGIWQIIFTPQETATGEYYLYLPASNARSLQTRFYRPSPQVTLTIPSTASKVISVGAYDSSYNAYADFSGRGFVYPRRTIGVVTAGLVKPDLAAPGVDIMAPDIYGGYQSVTGTSFATPLVSGCAALLMEWGIVRGNDPFLYGEKVKAYLRGGARPIRGEMDYPNDRVGFGALCLAESFPE
ncbi:MAG: S8 family serine peptidase [Clostridium sp.]|nr:S8 family serine peptidase [Clostridium sp.]